jgi:hypothetical protein
MLLLIVCDQIALVGITIGPTPIENGQPAKIQYSHAATPMVVAEVAPATPLEVPVVLFCLPWWTPTISDIAPVSVGMTEVVATSVVLQFDFGGLNDV